MKQFFLGQMIICLDLIDRCVQIMDPRLGNSVKMLDMTNSKLMGYTMKNLKVNLDMVI